MKIDTEYKALTIKEFTKAAEIYEMHTFCTVASLQPTTLEARKKLRLHLATRKPATLTMS